MKSKVISVNTLTPTFMGGAFGQNDNIRTSQIKGLMRIAFRLIAGKYITHDIKGINILKEKEGMIFGDTSRKSPFTIKISNQNLDYCDIELFPHKNKFKNKKTLISPNSSFNLHLTVKKPIKHNFVESLEFLSSLLRVGFLIGIGYRKNRFLGNMCIDDFSLKDEVSELEKFCKEMFQTGEKSIKLPLFPSFSTQKENNNLVKNYKVFSIPLKKAYRENFEILLKDFYEKVIHTLKQDKNYSCLIGSAKPRQPSFLNFSLYKNKIFVFSFFYKSKTCIYSNDSYNKWQKGTEEAIKLIQDSFEEKKKYEK